MGQLVDHPDVGVSTGTAAAESQRHPASWRIAGAMRIELP
jgi:hypothetical protein